LYTLSTPGIGVDGEEERGGVGEITSTFKGDCFRDDDDGELFIFSWRAARYAIV
jgi:hypothetical protein